MLDKLHLTTWPRRLAVLLVMLLIAVRLAAPSLITSLVNHKLASLEGYSGHIDGVAISLWRGAYEIQGIVIEKDNGKVPVPFVRMEELDLGLEWGALLDGRIVAKVTGIRPEINFVKGPTKATSQAGAETDWKKTVEDLVPMEINKLKLVDGEIHYRDFHSSPKVDVILDHLDATVSNLTNSKSFSGSRVAKVDARGTLMRSGQLEIHGALDPFSPEPTFDLTSSVEHLQLTELNEFLKAYVDVDVEKGWIAVYSKLHAKEGRFDGYVKPLVEGLQILDWKKDEGLFAKVWEGLVGGVAQVMKNQPNDRLAAQIPLSGRFDHPDVNGWAAAFSLLRNAFIQALQHGLDAHKS